MNPDMLIQPNDKIYATFGRNDDGTNNGSISVERKPGHVYCIAKAPRYASDEEWKYNANLIVKALSVCNLWVRETYTNKGDKK